MSEPMHDMSLLPPCPERPGLRCLQATRIDERIFAIAWGIGRIIQRLECQPVSVSERELLEREKQTLHDAVQLVPLIEELVEERRRAQ